MRELSTYEKITRAIAIVIAIVMSFLLPRVGQWYLVPFLLGGLVLALIHDRKKRSRPEIPIMIDVKNQLRPRRPSVKEVFPDRPIIGVGFRGAAKSRYVALKPVSQGSDWSIYLSKRFPRSRKGFASHRVVSEDEMNVLLDNWAVKYLPLGKTSQVIWRYRFCHEKERTQKRAVDAYR